MQANECYSVTRYSLGMHGDVEGLLHVVRVIAD